MLSNFSVTIKSAKAILVLKLKKNVNRFKSMMISQRVLATLTEIQLLIKTGERFRYVFHDPTQNALLSVGVECFFNIAKTI